MITKTKAAMLIISLCKLISTAYIIKIINRGVRCRLFSPEDAHTLIGKEIGGGENCTALQ